MPHLTWLQSVNACEGIETVYSPHLNFLALQLCLSLQLLPYHP